MIQKLANQYFIDVMDILKLSDDCHVYLVDLNDRLLAANQKQLQVIQKITGIKTNSEIIGTALESLYANTQAVELVKKENQAVIKQKKAKLYYNVWKIENYKKITLITMKTPLYNTKKQIIGVFGISVYLSEASLENNIKIDLSARETECLNFLLRGKTTKEIAHSTKLSTRTIEGYLTNVKRKLQVHSKSALINKAMNIGIDKINKLVGAISKDYESGIFMPKE